MTKPTTLAATDAEQAVRDRRHAIYELHPDNDWSGWLAILGLMRDGDKSMKIRFLVAAIALLASFNSQLAQAQMRGSSSKGLEIAQSRSTWKPNDRVVVPRIVQRDGQFVLSKTEYLLVTVENMVGQQLQFSYTNGNQIGNGTLPARHAMSLQEAQQRGLNILNVGSQVGTPRQVEPPPTQPPAIASGNFSSQQVQELLNAHNTIRRAVGANPALPDLRWSNSLATSAQSWANTLARQNRFEHSKTSYGENLFMGTAGAYSLTRMVNSWGSEKKDFRYGAFPNVSRTGSWFDVGHYTQIVWRNTTEVGCGLATNRGSSFLVCQYNPPGNYRGQRPY